MNVLSYLFSPIPGAAFSYETELTIYCATIFALGIFIKLILLFSKRNKALNKTLRITPPEFIWISMITYILMVSRTKGVPYLGMRMLLFIAIALSVFYVAKALFRLIRKYPEYKKVVQPKKTIKAETKYSTKK